MSERIQNNDGHNGAMFRAILFGGIGAVMALVLTLIPVPKQGGVWKEFIEVFHNCGFIFAPAMAFCWLFGLAYLSVLWRRQRIPSVRFVRTGIEKMLPLFEQRDKLQQENRRMRGAATNADKPESSVADSNDGEFARKLFNENESPDVAPTDQPSPQQADASGSKLSEETIGTEAQTQQVQAEQIAQQIQVVDQDINIALAAIHPWPQRRIKRVITKALFLQGPDAARAENQALADQDESDVAAGLILPTICEWMLPLLGFIGTVWGLHKTIPPLKEGIEQMMQAMALSGPEATTIRKDAIVLFTSAFDNLRTAFDTTLLGLTAVLFVGTFLYLTRKRAMLALTEVHEIVERVISSCGKQKEESIHKHLFAILEALRMGLFETKQDKPASLIAGIRQVVSRGLLSAEKDQKEPQPLIAAAARSIKNELQEDTKAIIQEVQRDTEVIQKEVRQDTKALANIDLNILKENRLQSLIQFRSLGPDLKIVRNKLCEDEPVPDEYLIDPDISLVAELPEKHKIHALTVANGATKACVGSLRSDINQNFVQETAIIWTHEGYSLQPGISFVASAVHTREGSEGPSMQIAATIVDLTYDPRAKRLFAICKDGVARVIDEGTMKDCASFKTFFVMEHPFVWLTGVGDYPAVGGWQGENDEDQDYRFTVTMLGIDTPIRLVNGMQEVFAGFTLDEDDARGLGQVKMASDRDLLCLAGRRTLAIGRIKQSFNLELIARMNLDLDVSALDISSEGRFVVYGLADGSIFKWHFDAEKSSPICLVHPNENTNASSLHISTGGNSLGVLADSTITLHELDGSESPRLFDTYGQPVTHVAQTLDRSSLLVATQANMIMLFNFGMKVR